MIDYPCWLLQRYEGADFTYIDQGDVPVARVPLFA